MHIKGLHNDEQNDARVDHPKPSAADGNHNLAQTGRTHADNCANNSRARFLKLASSPSDSIISVDGCQSSLNYPAGTNATPVQNITPIA
jgi:hypothetical protein